MSVEKSQEKTMSSLKLAVLLGLLTFVVTGLSTLIIIIPLFLLGINLAAVFLHGVWGGHAIAQFGLFIFIALLGDLGTAIISWFINRSKELASVTFISALIFQLTAIAVFVPTTLKKSQVTMNAGISREKSYEQYARIGDVSVESQEPFKFSYGINGKLTEVILFKKLVFTIPVSVTRAGAYLIHVTHTSNSSFYANSDSPSSSAQVLDVGDHIIKMAFIAGEAANLGYESPAAVQGRAEVQLDYLASRKELLSSLDSDNALDPKVLQQFMKDEHLDQRSSSNSTVNKFVGRKEVQF